MFRDWAIDRGEGLPYAHFSDYTWPVRHGAQVVPFNSVIGY